MTLRDRLEIFKNKGYKYDKETGIITSPKNKIIDGVSHGYIIVSFRYNNKSITIKGQQLAWYLEYNEVPIVIDHINRISTDNRLSNLRNITQQKNNFNKNPKGYFKSYGKFRAVIRLNNKNIHLGSFKTEEEAHQAYLDAKKIYHII